MIFSTLAPAERKQWSLAAAIAFAAHLGVVAMAVAWVRPAAPVIPEPVVLMELPPKAAPAPAVAEATPTEVQPEYVPPRVVMPPIDVPPVAAPLPRDPVILPPPPPPVRVSRSVPEASAAPAVANPISVSATGTGTGTSAAPGNDPKARKQEADYFALVSAHLNRQKVYPAEAKKARQQGVVTVRFTVDRLGNVSAESIKRTSGYGILDQTTIDLVRRVSPLPRMPASMARDAITLSLPIEYALKTN